MQPLHEAVGARLAASDQDLEVKDAAISCTAACVALLGDALAAQVPPTLQVVPPSTALPLPLICNPPPVAAADPDMPPRATQLPGLGGRCARGSGAPCCRAWSDAPKN